jgi:hypothetical protein
MPSAATTSAPAAQGSHRRAFAQGVGKGKKDLLELVLAPATVPKAKVKSRAD